MWNSIRNGREKSFRAVNHGLMGNYESEPYGVDLAGINRHIPQESLVLYQWCWMEIWSFLLRVPKNHYMLAELKLHCLHEEHTWTPCDSAGSISISLSWILCSDTSCSCFSFPFHVPCNALSPPFASFTFSFTIPSAPFPAFQWLSSRQHAACVLLQVTQIIAGQWQLVVSLAWCFLFP